MEELIEKPSFQILYRQSSLETRLSPIDLSMEALSSSEESGNEEKETDPRLVKFQMKSENANQSKAVPSDTHDLDGKTGKNKFQQELQTMLTKKINVKTKVENNESNNQNSQKVGQQYQTDKRSLNVENNTDFKEELKTKLKQKKMQEKNDLPAKPVIPIKRTNKYKSEENIVLTNIECDIKQTENKNSSELLQDEKLLNVSENMIDLSKPKIPVKPTKKCKSEKVIYEINDLQQPENKNSSMPFIKQNELLNVSEDMMIIPANEEITPISSVGLIKAFIITKKVAAETEEMASARPKSPRPVAIKGEKDESIWDKLGTLGRKKRIKEVQEVQAEGKYAIDSPGCPTAPVIPPEEYNLDDNEERCIIDPRAYEDPKFKELLNVLKEWVNDELASQRIIVQDLSEDLYDGQVLQKLLEKLTGDKLDVPEVTQSEEGQKQKLSVVLDHFNQVLGIQRISHNKWSVEAIHSKNIVSITHLLVALARHFRPPVRLPEHVSVDVVIVQKIKGALNHKIVRESLTKSYDDVGMRCERDAFDTLFDHAPDKLQVVKKSLVTFVNKHLNKMNFEVTEIESQFHDGVYLIMLMGLLEGFFVPHYSFHLTPHEFDQKVHNVNFAFELMEEVGLQKPKARPEDVVNMDLKSTLRVLYNLFLKYKTIL